MTNNDYILKSEVRKMIKKMETYIEQSVEHEWIDKSDLLSELDKLPTISPVEIIEEEIKNCIENMDKNESESWRYSYWNARKLALIDVLQKFKSLS